MKKSPLLKRKPNAHHNGFTLVELLVVIAIIAVLAALVIGGSIRIRQKAYEATALNSIRQVTTANVSYSMENFGDINVLLDEGDPRGAGDKVSNSYWGRLIPYLFDDITTTDQAEMARQLKVRLAGLFATNDASTMPKTFQAGAEIHHDDSGLPVPFGFSNSVYQADKYKKTSQYENPALTIYMAYGFKRFDQSAGQKYYPIPKKGTARSTNIDFFPSKTAAFTFLDGHVEMLSTPVNERHFPAVPQ